ncbi:MAG: uroporphyrinogen-III synthase [Ignavibacteriales bacterium]|nr:uroporphyrinogen-III synthase [Ignavibacteriales bacterium]
MSSLSGKTILLTRSEEANVELARLFEKHGAQTLSLPTVHFVEPDSWEQCDAAITNLREYDGILFTSKNAVTSFLTRLESFGGQARSLLASRALYAIGEKTQEALESAGFAVAASPEIAAADDLTELLGEEAIRGKRFLFPKSNIARAILPNALRALNAVVDEVVVYKNEPPTGQDLDQVREVLLQRRVDTVTFFSPSAVRNFVQLLGTRHLESTTVAVIGPTTAQAAGDVGVRVDVVAPRATAEALIESLERYFLSPT